MTSLKSQLESILFVSNKPLKASALAKILEIAETEIVKALDEIAQEKKASGIVLLKASDGYQFSTNSENSPQVKNFLNSELREKLTDATIETLAIIAYRQPISKSEIEAIRGVNSQYSVRILLMRGLVEKVANPNDARGSYYQVTTEFLQHLGLTSIKDLPDFDVLVKEIKLPEIPLVAPETIETDTKPETQLEPEETTPPVTQNEPDPELELPEGTQIESPIENPPE